MEDLEEPPDQRCSLRPPAQPAGVLSAPQTYQVQPSSESSLAQPNSTVDSKIDDFISNVFFPIIWLWIMLTIFLSATFYLLSLEMELRIEQVIGCVTHFTIAYLVFFSADIREIKNFYIALGLFVVWSASLCIITIKSSAENFSSRSIEEKLFNIHIFEIIFEVITFCFFWCFKKRFDKFNKPEN